MIHVRRKADLDHSRRDWLDAYHHFIVTPDGKQEHKPVGPLIVWNDDTLAPGRGFPPHSHVDLEIFTYVIEGAIDHWDNEGNVGRIDAGDVQVMSAGSGIAHEEKADPTTPTRLFQLWLLPRHRAKAPDWEIRPFPKRGQSGVLTLLASGHGEPAAVPIDADARILGATIDAGRTLTHSMTVGRQAYLVVAKGSVDVNGTLLGEGDGAVIDEPTVRIEAAKEAEVIVVEVG